MSAKPTAGPYTVEASFESYVVCTPTNSTIAIFTADNGMEIDEAEANARAWVDGMVAKERLERIRAVIDSVAWGESKLVEVRAILDEAKP